MQRGKESEGGMGGTGPAGGHAAAAAAAAEEEEAADRAAAPAGMSLSR